MIGSGRPKVMLEFPNMSSRKVRTLPLLRPINTDILLSLRSFWSCFDFSLPFSESLDLVLSLLSLEVPASLLSPCRLLRELDLSSEGRPKSTDDFFCEELGVVGTPRLDSLFGERLALTRWNAEAPVPDDDRVGDVDTVIGFEGGICML